jgi:SAM-dependent methyltransferase
VDSTEFYDRLAPLFDIMTDWPARLATEVPFLEGVCQAYAVRRILDAACGTGHHAIALAQRGYQVAGTDSSPRMIDRARQNGQQAGIAIDWRVAAFTALPNLFQEPFDAVLCLGNSLPHLLTTTDLQAAIQGMIACLRPGGILVVQNLNYDKRVRERPRWFPVNGGLWQGRETLIWRFATYYDSGPLEFSIAVFIKWETGWTVDVASTWQRPLLRRDLAWLLEGTGMDRLTYYGSMTGEPYRAATSTDLIIVAQKKTS